MASKAHAKRKARGIVCWFYRECIGEGVGLGLTRNDAAAARAVLVGRPSPMMRAMVRAGCPRLKPGEVKKVRVIIEELK